MTVIVKGSLIATLHNQKTELGIFKALFDNFITLLENRRF